MYIIAIGWLFVTVLMAAAEAMTTSLVAGMLTLLFYGVVPVGLILYLLGTPERRRRQQRAEAPAPPSEETH